MDERDIAMLRVCIVAVLAICLMAVVGWLPGQ